MLSVLLTVLLLIAGVPQRDNSVRVDYDRFKKVTTVTTLSLPLRQPKTPRTMLETLEVERERYSTYLIVGFTYPGQTMQRSPRFVVLGFYLDKRYFSLRGTSLIALVDGERIVLPKVSGAGESFLPIQTFRRLARGKSIELQIGSEEFTLPDETIQAFKEIERHAHP